MADSDIQGAIDNVVLMREQLMSRVFSGAMFATTSFGKTGVALTSAVEANAAIDAMEQNYRSYLTTYSGLGIPAIAMDFRKQIYTEQEALTHKSKTLSQLVTFSRASVATRWGADGYIQEVEVDAPRIGYDPVNGKCLGMQMEPSATNHVVQSENAGDDYIMSGSSDWSGSLSYRGLTLGQYTRGLYYRDYAMTDSSHITASIFFFDRGDYTGTGYQDVFRLEARDTEANQAMSAFNLKYSPTDKVFYSTGTDPDYTYKIESLGIGFYRISMTLPSTGVSAGQLRARVALYSAAGYRWWIGGMQVESGAIATSYIRTAGAQATREADRAQLVVFPQISDTSFTVLMELTQNAVAGSAFSISSDTAFRFGLPSNNSRMVNGLYDAPPTSYTLGEEARIAVSFHESGTLIYAVNGTPFTLTNKVSGVSPLEAFRIGHLAGSNNNINGFISSLEIRPDVYAANQIGDL